LGGGDSNRLRRREQSVLLKLRRQRSVIRQHEIENMPILHVGPLDAVHKWAALQSDFVGIIGNLFVGGGTTNGHRKLKVDDVSVFPGSVQTHVTLLEF